MATPKELIACVAEMTGVPLATVIVHDRNLAEEGLRTPALRGRGVSRVSYHDAANLLIAVAASRNVKDSVKTVRDYVDIASHDPLFSGAEVRGRTFGDALAALLEAVAAARESFGGPEGDRITVLLYGPQPRARIDVIRQGEKPQEWNYEAPWPSARRPSAGDLTYIAEFTQVTIGHVGTLVASD